MKSNMEGKLYSREQNNVHQVAPSNFDLKLDYVKAIKKVQLMGIVNVTPDSFYANSRYPTPKEAIAYGKQLIEEGADWLDIGGESTRPFAKPVAEEEEIQRVIPVVEALAPLINVSVDTRKAAVAKKAIESGACLINDISGFTDPEMCEVLAQSNVKCCLMHAQGNPENMQINPSYPKGAVATIQDFFLNQIHYLSQWGIEKERLILDPGLGFGKTVADCWAILSHLKALVSLGFPVLLGISRKSFLQKTLNKSADDLLLATVICATVSTLAGVSYFRVHDMNEHREMVKLLELLIK